MEVNINQILQQTLSNDSAQIAHAHAALQQLEERDLGAFVSALLTELASADRPIQVRQQAAIQLKNSFTSKDEAKEAALQQRWLSLPETIRTPIREGLLKTLADPNAAVRSTAALAVGKLAAMEIPSNSWPNIVETLVGFIVTPTSPAELKQSSFQALGIICDDAGRFLQAKSSFILNAIAVGMHKDQPDDNIKLAATRALSLSLDFVRPNFERPAERQQILALVGFAATQSPNVQVRVAAFQCLVEIAATYYSHLRVYMPDLFNLTTGAIQREAEQIALQALEFWATIAEEELALIEENEEAQEDGRTPPNTVENLIKTALPPLAPLLLTCLTNQSEEVNEDTWDKAMAAGTCLGLFAQVVRDDILPHVLPFVEQNIANPNWRLREAAGLAFGFLLDGPSKKALAAKVKTLFPPVVHQLNDPHPHVKDTAAWTIGRICDLVPAAIEEYLPNLMAALIEGLKSPPRVSANVCWAIHNLAHRVEVGPTASSSVLSPYFQPVVAALIATADRPDAGEAKLMPCAYEAINGLINKAAPDVYPLVTQLIPVLCNKLQATVLAQGLTGEERERQSEVQAHICGALQAVIQKLSGDIVRSNADTFMRLFLAVLQSKNATVSEEALMAIGALANKMERDFDRYMPHFIQPLVLGLKNAREYQVCTVAVGVVGDVARAIEGKLISYSDEIMISLFQNLQNPAVQRSVKPRIIECLGDIAMALGGHFERYMASTMMILTSASATKFEHANADLEEYLKTLRESILAAYTGIVQGLNADNKAGLFLGFLPNVVPFLDLLAHDALNDNDILYASTGLIGDIIQRVGVPSKPFMIHEGVRQLISAATNSRSSRVRSNGSWAQTLYTNTFR